MDVNNFLEQLHNDTRPKPKLVSDNDMMNIIHSWLKKLTKQAVDFLNPKGKPPRTKINYLGHMFAKAGIPKDVAYKYPRSSRMNTTRLVWTWNGSKERLKRINSFIMGGRSYLRSPFNN